MCANWDGSMSQRLSRTNGEGEKERRTAVEGRRGRWGRRRERERGGKDGRRRGRPAHFPINEKL